MASMSRKQFIPALIAVASCLAAEGASVPLVDLRQTPFTRTTAEGSKRVQRTKGGQLFELSLGSKRTAWTRNDWRMVEFETAKDLSDFDAVRLVVATDVPRDDAGVYLWLREADGSSCILM